MPLEREKRIWRRLRLRDLETLQAIAEAGSMAKAAERLSLSQPAVSKAVQALEETLGVPILDRTHRGVEVTPYGRVLIKYARDMFDDLGKGLAELSFMQDPSRGHLRVGSPEPATGVLAGIMADLLADLPEVTFNVIVADTAVLFQALRERSADVVLTRLVDPNIAPDVDFERIFDDQLVVIAGAQNPLARKRNVELSDLVNEPWVLPPKEAVLGWFAAEIFQARGLSPPTPAVVTTSFQMRVALLKRGRCLTLAPAAMIADAKEYGLARVPLELPETLRPVGVAKLAGRATRPLLNAFVARARRAHRLRD